MIKKIVMMGLFVFLAIAFISSSSVKATAPKVIKVATGSYYSLALWDDGTVSAWGRKFGQLGFNSTTQQNLPVKLGLSNIKDISAFDDHAMALTISGNVYAWGYNGYGELGDGTTSNSLVPLLINALPTIVQIAAGGHHSLALTNTGDVYAWGDNSFSQVDGQTLNNQPTPVMVKSGILSIAAGENYSLALTGSGTVYAWGNNQEGQTRNGSITTAISSLTGVADIRAGQYHALALTVTGAVYSWGYNGSGQLGDGTINASISSTGPLVPVFSSGIASIYAGERNSFAIKQNGTIMGWGDNSSYQMGVTDTFEKPSPIPINSTTLPAATSIASGTGHTLAVKTDGTVMAAGAGMDGQLGAASTPFNTIGYFTPSALPFAFLSGLQIYEPSAGSWTQHFPVLSFNSNTLTYSLAVPGQSWGICVTPSSSNGTITINNSVNHYIGFTSCYQVPLSVGPNTINITVQSYVDSSVTQTYSLIITRSLDTTSPSLVSADVNQGIDRVTVKFDEPLDPASVNASGFSVKAGGTSIPIKTTTLDMTGLLLTLTLNAPLAYDQAATLDVLQGAVKDSSGNLIQTNNNVSISNPYPMLVSADANIQGDQILLHFDRPLNILNLLNSFNFSVYTDSVQSQAVSINAATYADDLSVLLSLNTNIANNQTNNINIGSNAVKSSGNNNNFQGIVGFPVSFNGLKKMLDVDLNGKIGINDIVKLMTMAQPPDLNFDGQFDQNDILFMLMQIDPI